MKQLLKKIVPRGLLSQLLPAYHLFLAWFGAVLYRYPSRELVVIGITGTKGKTTSVELLNSILVEAGFKTAVLSTLRFKIGDDSKRNLLKMTMPGRFFIQQKLREAVWAGCTHAVIEMTSEGAKQFRNRWIDLNALILTNIAPEHIESHGSYENYVRAKISIAEGLARSKKQRRFLVVNKESPEAEKFFAVENVEHLSYDSETAQKLGITTRLEGGFNLLNASGAATVAQALGISLEAIRNGILKCTGVPGRMELVTLTETTLPFSVIVDYAHTPDSLEAAYSSFPGKRKLCVLGGTGGGRDTWKRPAMGTIAEKNCAKIFLTDEDPYDEDPEKIVLEVAQGITKGAYEIEMDRRVAMRKAFHDAQPGDVVFITGKGTDPFIMGPNGTKTPWSDADIAREELRALVASTTTSPKS